MSAIGFSAPRAGITRAQVDQLTSMLARVHRPFQTFRWGCSGLGDLAGAQVAKRLGFHLIGHPGHPLRGGPNPWHVEFPNDRTFPAQPFLVRNRDIVNRSVVLIATPATFTPPHGGGSGTWYTINYATRTGKPTYLILPDGSMETRNTQRIVGSTTCG